VKNCVYKQLTAAVAMGIHVARRTKTPAITLDSRLPHAPRLYGRLYLYFACR
jgi:hypothetical protein